MFYTTPKKDLTKTPKQATSRKTNMTGSNLVKEILHQVCNADIVEMSMSQQELLEVLEFGDGVIAVPHSLTTLFTFDT